MALCRLGVIGALCFFLCVQCLVLLPRVAAANPLYSALVVDPDTGAVLHENAADKLLHPASLTKVMTLIMLFDALKRGRIRMHDRMYVSAYAQGMIPSKIGLEAGESIRVRDAIAALATKSANDVAAVVAEHLGGSEKNFARMMTFRARQIGMKDTVFMNASGLHHKRQVSTARDMAVMAQFLIDDYRYYYKFFGQTEFTYRGVTYRSHNRLMETYSGMDGLKTGYISASGFNLISSAVRDGRRLIAVVFGGKTAKSRNAQMAKLLDHGFSRLRDIRIAAHVVPAPDAKPVPAMIAAEAVAVASVEPAAFSERRVRLVEQGSGDFRFDADAAWSIQVGAYSTEAQTMRALRKAVKRLPAYYKRGTPELVPLNISGSDLYRARLSGYNAHDAFAACAYIQECITISP